MYDFIYSLMKHFLFIQQLQLFKMKIEIIPNLVSYSTNGNQFVPYLIFCKMSINEHLEIVIKQEGNKYKFLLHAMHRQLFQDSWFSDNHVPWHFTCVWNVSQLNSHCPLL